MIINPLRRTAFVAVAAAVLALPAAAEGENALSAALGAMQARVAAMARLKPLSQAPAAVRAVAASSGRAPLNLICEIDGGGSAGFLVDFDAQTVAPNPGSSCKWDINGRELYVPNCYPAGAAVITASSFSWETTRALVSGTGVVTTGRVTGYINRLTTAFVLNEYWPNGNPLSQLSGTCRPAQQRF